MVANGEKASDDALSNVKLKILAGLLDVEFDALKQREHQRHYRHLMAITSLAVFLASWGQASHPRARRPNVFLITIDTLRADHVHRVATTWGRALPRA